MIGTGDERGVSPAAALHSLALGDINDHINAALGLNRLATMSGGLVKAINLSFFSQLGFFEEPDGNSHLTQFVDWSARQHDVLYVVAWGNEEQDEFRVPQDNFNGLTVAESERIGGIYQKYSGENAFDTNVSDAQRIDMIAPGNDVTVRYWDEVVDTESGTSYAAPTVVGATALLQQYVDQQIGNGNPQFGFTAYRHEVMKAVILNSADKLADVHGSTRDIVDSQGLNWRFSEAFVSEDISLDNEMGAGHLNVERAVQQLSPGEQNPGMVPSIGWDYHTIGGSGSRTEYFFDSEIGGDYLAVTLTWDRRVELTDPDGTYTFGDQFFERPIEQSLNNLDLYLMRADSDNLTEAITASYTLEDNVEHIFFDNFSPGAYKLVVRNNFLNGIGDSQNYALAWWFGDAPATTTPGDFNNDGNVDAADYVMWRKTNGSSMEYDEWVENFGSTSGSGGDVAVPEPAAGAMVVVLAAWLCLGRGRVPLAPPVLLLR